MVGQIFWRVSFTLGFSAKSVSVKSSFHCIESKVGHWPYLCFIGSVGSVQEPKKSGKDSRKSAVIRKRLSELTRTIGQQSMEGETDLGDKENQMSLLMNEPEDLLQDMSLTEN